MPGINGYFGQVGSGLSQSLRPSRDPIAPTTSTHNGLEAVSATIPEAESKSRRSSTSSGSMVMVERNHANESTPPLQPGEPAQKTNAFDNARLPPTPISSASSFMQKDGDSAENGKPVVESGISAVTQALRNFVLPKSSSSVKSRRHQSLPVSSLITNPVTAAHISNPASSPQSPAQRAPRTPPSRNDKPKVSKSFKELSRLTSRTAG